MDKYIIQPLAALIKSPDRDYVKLGDLLQNYLRPGKYLSKKITEPPARRHRGDRARVSKDYPGGRKKPNPPGPPIEKSLITQVDQLIRGEGLFLITQEQKKARAISYLEGLASTAVKDIAFYHPAASRRPKSHHRFEGMKSICYARLENDAEATLIGNLQIDFQKAPKWKNPAAQTILTSKKNLYRALVQEVLNMSHRPVVKYCFIRVQ